MPQVIVIDEISTKLEAMAASTIAQRGIQLVATAHGITIRNLINNPSLEMLVGGIQVKIFFSTTFVIFKIRIIFTNLKINNLKPVVHCSECDTRG